MDIVILVCFDLTVYIFLFPKTHTKHYCMVSKANKILSLAFNIKLVIGIMFLSSKATL